MCSKLLTLRPFFVVSDRDEEWDGRKISGRQRKSLYTLAGPPFAIPSSITVFHIKNTSILSFFIEEKLGASAVFRDTPQPFIQYGVSVNTTSAPSATCLCRLPQPPARNRPSMYSFFAQKLYGLLSF